MKTQADAFKRILEVLNRLEIPYMLVESWTSQLDFDLVVNLRADQIEEFAARLKLDFLPIRR